MANEKWLIDGNKLFELVRDDHRINGSTFSRVKEYMDDSTIDAVEVVHGQWIKNGWNDYSCSVCRCQLIGHGASGWEYCPHCGARMDLEG